MTKAEIKKLLRHDDLIRAQAIYYDQLIAALIDRKIDLINLDEFVETIAEDIHVEQGEQKDKWTELMVKRFGFYYGKEMIRAKETQLYSNFKMTRESPQMKKPDE